jgi:hypothetical protein
MIKRHLYPVKPAKMALLMKIYSFFSEKEGIGGD